MRRVLFIVCLVAGTGTTDTASAALMFGFDTADRPVSLEGFEVNGGKYDVALLWNVQQSLNLIGDLPIADVTEARAGLTTLLNASENSGWHALDHALYIDFAASSPAPDAFENHGFIRLGDDDVASGFANVFVLQDSINESFGVAVFTIATTPVPEPSSAILLALAAGVGAVAYRRKRKALELQPAPNSASAYGSGLSAA